MCKASSATLGLCTALMHGAMMGGMMGGMTNCCGAMVLVWPIAFLLIAVVVAAAIILFRRKPRH